MLKLEMYCRNVRDKAAKLLAHMLELFWSYLLLKREMLPKSIHFTKRCCLTSSHCKRWIVWRNWMLRCDLPSISW